MKHATPTQPGSASPSRTAPLCESASSSTPCAATAPRPSAASASRTQPPPTSLTLVRKVCDAVGVSTSDVLLDADVVMPSVTSRAGCGSKEPPAFGRPLGCFSRLLAGRLPRSPSLHSNSHSCALPEFGSPQFAPALRRFSEAPAYLRGPGVQTGRDGEGGQDEASKEAILPLDATPCVAFWKPSFRSDSPIKHPALGSIVGVDCPHAPRLRCR